MNNEGLGVYFSTILDVAASYGKYIYIIEVNDRVVYDFTKRKVCERFINAIAAEVYLKCGVNIRDILGSEAVNSLTTYMHCGGISIYGLDREINLLLDSTEEWYTSYSESRRRSVLSCVSKYIKNQLLVYLFTYNIKDVGIIKRLDPSYVKLVQRINTYTGEKKIY